MGHVHPSVDSVALIPRHSTSSAAPVIITLATRGCWPKFGSHLTVCTDGVHIGLFLLVGTGCLNHRLYLCVSTHQQPGHILTSFSPVCVTNKKTPQPCFAVNTLHHVESCLDRVRRRARVPAALISVNASSPLIL